METLPVELLQTIWSELCSWSLSEPSEETIDEPEAHLRSLLPGRLGAVCRHWRHIVLNTPELWTCILLRLVPSFRSVEPLLRHVTLQLDRSRTLPLELVLVESSLARDAPQASPNLMSLLHIAAQHTSRWRFAKLRLCDPHTLSALCELLHGRSTPLLEEFHLEAPGEMKFDASWLSAASPLTTISTRGARLYLPPTLRLTTVVSAHIDVDVMDLNHLWCSLCALPALRSLSLRQVGALNLMGPATPKPTLSFLETLKLRGSFDTFAHVLSPSMSAPRLKRLNIETSAVDECAAGEWCPDFFAAFSTIVELELVQVAGGPFITNAQGYGGGASHGSRLAALSQLERLKCVTFTWLRFPARSTEPNRHCGLFVVLDTDGPTAAHTIDVCRAAACPPPALVWPQLESLTLCDVDPRDAGDELLADLLCFARTRALACQRGQHFSLKILDWPAQFPSWFREALGCTLGPAHVHLTTSDGAVHAPVADDSDADEEEAEAQFTESDTASNASSSGTESDLDDVYSDEGEWMPRRDE